MLQHFQDNFIYGEACSSHFFRVTTSTQQLHFWSSCLFRAAVFSFFRTATFSQQLFFQNSFFFRARLLQSSHFWRIRKFFMAVTFRNSYFFSEELFRIRISEKELPFQSRYFGTASTFSEKLHYGKS